MTPKEFKTIQLRQQGRNHEQMNYINEVIREARLEQAEKDIDALLAATQPCLTVVFGDVE